MTNKAPTILNLDQITLVSGGLTVAYANFGAGKNKFETPVVTQSHADVLIDNDHVFLRVSGEQA